MMVEPPPSMFPRLGSHGSGAVARVLQLIPGWRLQFFGREGQIGAAFSFMVFF